MKTDKIVQISINKSERRKKDVISSINDMRKNGEKINFYTVMKKTKASKSFLYCNKEIRLLIENERKQAVKPRSGSSNKVIIEAQARKIKELQDEIKELKNQNNKNDSIKAKYDKVLLENEELKKQIKNSIYSYN